MKVSEISEILNDWMPTSIAEDFDNVGLIVGNPESLVTNILITLDTTSEVIDEAIKKDCNLIISYHPIIFNGLKKITSDSGYVQKSIINAVKFSSSSIFTNTVKTSANPPLVIHIFSPLMTQWSPSSLKVVLIPAASEPFPGSVKQNEANLNSSV